MPPLAILALLALVQAMAVSAALVPVARALAPRLGMVDRPTEARKIHDRPIPRAGGLAIFAAFWGCLLVDLAIARYVLPGMDGVPAGVKALAANVALRFPQLAGLAAGSTIIFALGVADDVFNLSPKLRLAVQFLAVVPLLAGGVWMRLFFLPPWAGMAATALWIVLLTNSFNFLDNMNGLASGVAAIVAVVLGLQSWMAGEYYMLLLFALLAGAATGFWFYNFPKASIFLGDGGSTHLGFLFGALSTLATYWKADVPTPLPVLMPAIALGVPLFDTASVMWIRWRSGKPLMQGDTNHFSHRLVALGMTRVEAVAFIYGVTLLVGLAALVLRALEWEYALVQTAAIGMVFLGIYWMEKVGRRRRNGG